LDGFTLLIRERHREQTDRLARLVVSGSQHVHRDGWGLPVNQKHGLSFVGAGAQLWPANSLKFDEEWSVPFLW